MVDTLRRIGENIYSVKNPDRIHGLNKRKGSEKHGPSDKRKNKNKKEKNTESGRIDAIA